MVDFNKLLAQARRNNDTFGQAQLPTTQQPQAATLVTPPPLPDKPKLEPAAVAPTPLNTLDLGIDEVKPDEVKEAVVDYPGLVDLQQRIHALEDALKANHPAMESLLQTIHRNLQKDPELVHMLRPEDTSTIFAGLQKKTQTKIVEETVKSARNGKNKGLKNIGLEDL